MKTAQLLAFEKRTAPEKQDGAVRKSVRIHYNGCVDDLKIEDDCKAIESEVIKIIDIIKQVREEADTIYHWSVDVTDRGCRMSIQENGRLFELREGIRKHFDAITVSHKKIQRPRSTGSPLLLDVSF